MIGVGVVICIYQNLDKETNLLRLFLFVRSLLQEKLPRDGELVVFLKVRPCTAQNNLQNLTNPDTILVWKYR